jgi:hypothetical protein
MVVEARVRHVRERAWYVFSSHVARECVDVHDTPETSGCGAPWAGWGCIGGGIEIR